MMVEQCKQDMQKQQVILLDLATKAVNYQIAEAINRTVKSNAKITIRGSENGKLSDLKKKMNSLINAEVRKKIEQGFDKFFQNDFKLIREKQDYELIEELYSMYKIIISEAGKLLRQYGYSSVYGEYESGNPGFVSTKNKGTIGPKPDDMELLEEQNRWITSCRKYIEAIDNIENERKATLEKKATELWENA